MHKTTKHFSLEPVKQGIYAAVATAGTGAVGNAGFVDLGKSILVFDSFNTPQAATELRDNIQSITDKPVSHLINSHWHGDHVRGNQAFRDTAIVATTETKSVMAARHPDRIAAQKADLPEVSAYIEKVEQQYAATKEDHKREELALQISFLKDFRASLPTLELVLPTETFDSTWSLNGLNRTVECVTLGGGHTSSDAVLYIPDERTCFIGDLVAVQTHMLIVDGDMQSWLSILHQLGQWDIDKVIPGHGPVAGADSIPAAVSYLEDLLERAAKLKTAGLSSEDVTGLEIPASYSNWSAPQVYFQNLRHLLTV
jgi:cyclase